MVQSDQDRYDGSGTGDRRREPSEGRGQSPTKRFVFSTWRDAGDRAMCTRTLFERPECVPVVARTGLAVAPLVVTDKRGSIELYCDRLHAGPCAWPWDVPDVFQNGEGGPDDQAV